MCHLQTFKVSQNKVGNLRIANHKFEIVVAVDAGTHVLVIVLEFLNSHNAITFVGLPDSHELCKDFVSSLAAALEVGVEAHVVSNSDVINGDLATSVFIKNGVSLVDHVATAIVKISTDGAQKFVERQLTVLVRIEVLDNLSDFNLREVHSVVTHGVLELNWGESAVTVTVHSLEHRAKTTNAVGTTFLTEINDLLLNFFKVADLNVLLHVWVAIAQVTTSCASEADGGLFFLKIDVAFIVNNSLGLVERLSESTGSCEGVGSRGSRHVGILTLKSFGVECDRAGLGVITLRDASSQFVISSLGCASVHASFDCELVITGVLLNELAVLSLHNFATDGVCSHILCNEVFTVSRIKVTLLVDRIDSFLSLGHLCHDLTLNFALHHVALAASAGNSVS